MNIELASDLLAQQLLRRIDSHAAGAFIEIGMGNVNFSFKWAVPLGFKCLAAEPLPSPALRAACSEYGVELAEVAIADHAGHVEMFCGEMNGNEISDISSMNPRWWGSGSKTRRVPSMTLASFFEKFHVRKTSFLKVDTEGSERIVIEGLLTIRAECLPELVLFEYGGGALKSSGTGGWTQEFFQNTLACLSVLKRLGYSDGHLLEQAFPEPRMFDIQSSEFSTLFPEEAIVGNVIVQRSACSRLDLEVMQRSILPQLAANVRFRHSQARREKFQYYKVRVMNGIRRRLPWRKRQP